MSNEIVKIEDISWEFEDIESCECIGTFEDEWVYDIEVADETHTFICNDILVHNSLYVSYEEIIKNTDWKGTGVDFILKFYELRFLPYFNKKLQAYAKKFNCENIQEFEMETISHTGFWLAKKKYALNIGWKEGGHTIRDGVEYPGQFFEPGKKMKYTGLEIIKKSSPKFARQIIREIVDYMFVHGNDTDVVAVTRQLKKYKEAFRLKELDDVCGMSAINGLEKYILDDRTSFKVGPKCPAQVKASGLYNYMLNTTASKYKNKYRFIKNGDKVKMYYVKGSDPRKTSVFAFPVGQYPIEFAPPIDYDVMFAKMVINPINRFIVAMGKPPIPDTLTVMKSLF